MAKRLRQDQWVYHLDRLQGLIKGQVRYRAVAGYADEFWYNVIFPEADNLIMDIPVEDLIPVRELPLEAWPLNEEYLGIKRVLRESSEALGLREQKEIISALEEVDLEGLGPREEDRLKGIVSALASPPRSELDEHVRLADLALESYVELVQFLKKDNG